MNVTNEYDTKLNNIGMSFRNTLVMIIHNNIKKFHITVYHKT